MAFNPSLPVHDADISSAELRNQFNALKALIDDLQTRLDALPGRGTDAFVSMTGNDATAAMGDPARPFRTAQAAFDAAAALPGARVLRFGAGDFGGITLAADWPERISLAGAGATVTRLVGISATGEPGVPGADETGGNAAQPGSDGGTGRRVRLATDGQIDLGFVDVTGGTGGSGGQNLDGTYTPGLGGMGGTGGVVELTGCVMGDVAANGDVFGQPGSTGTGSTGGTVTLIDCTAGVVAAHGQNGSFGPGFGGTVTLTRCLYGGVDVLPDGTFNNTPTAPGSGVSSNVVR